MTQQNTAILLAVLLNVFLLSVCFAVREVGEAAPDFRLQIAHSEQHYQLYGDPGVFKLLLFLKPEQRFGQDALKAIDAEFNAHPESGYKVKKILIYQGKEVHEELKDVMSRKKSPWLVLLDPEYDAHERYQVIVTPTVYLLAKDNRITHKFAGFSPMFHSRLRDALNEVSGISAVQQSASKMVETEEQAKALLHFSRAAQLEEKAMYDRAIAQYKRGLELDPTSATAELSLAALYLKVGNGGAALEIYQSIIRTNPKSLVARMGLADVYRAEGSYDKAERVLKGILEERPDAHEAHYSLGQILLLMGRKAEAEREFKSAGLSLPAEATEISIPNQAR